MLIVNISENRVMNIYARIRKVINIYKIWKKKKKKIFRKADHSRHFTRSLPPSPPSGNFFTYYVMLLYITFYFLSIFFIDFFLTMLCYNKMLVPYNFLIFNTLHLYFLVYYFIPSQLSLRIFMQFLLYIYPYPHFKHFLALFLKFINILKHI